MNPTTEKILVGVATAFVLSGGAYVMGAFEDGSTAMTEDQIEAVIKKVLVTDTGLTHAAALSDLNTTLTAFEASVNAKLTAIQDDIGDLEDSVGDLAGD